jgi:hypothetical protein
VVNMFIIPVRRVMGAKMSFANRRGAAPNLATRLTSPDPVLLQACPAAACVIDQAR